MTKIWIFRNLISDENFYKFTSSNLPLTNVHVAVKFQESDLPLETDCLEEMELLQISKSCKVFVIDFLPEPEAIYDNETISCSCIESEISIFNDIDTLSGKYQQLCIENSDATTKFTEIYSKNVEELIEGTWFKFSSVKGFRDVLNGKKIWLNWREEIHNSAEKNRERKEKTQFQQK